MAKLTRESLSKEIQQLPSLSVIVTHLLTQLQRDDVAMAELMEEASHDQALAARILHIANSPFYGLSAHIGSLKDAGTMLGIHTLYNIVTAAGIIGHFPPAEDQNFDRHSFWQHVIGTGICARVLAHHAGMDQELAFTAGLLHDIGKVVMAVYFEEDFARVLAYRDEHDCLIREAEQAVLGFDHTLVGAQVAQSWKLPKPVVDAIKSHHSLPATSLPLAELIHLSDILCRGLNIGHGGDDLIPFLKSSVLARLGLNWDIIRSYLGEIENLNRFSDQLIDSAS
ncbi:MAG: HDOD domain-containing protein [Gammaproteobacteria bacterium]|nr:HDOD domain-containing protein [Gammaproteobacteria bacterium]